MPPASPNYKQTRRREESATRNYLYEGEQKCSYTPPKTVAESSLSLHKQKMAQNHLLIGQFGLDSLDHVLVCCLELLEVFDELELLLDIVEGVLEEGYSELCLDLEVGVSQSCLFCHTTSCLST